jgi:hypothetical protein
MATPTDFLPRDSALELCELPPISKAMLICELIDDYLPQSRCYHQLESDRHVHSCLTQYRETTPHPPDRLINTGEIRRSILYP